MGNFRFAIEEFKNFPTPQFNMMQSLVILIYLQRIAGE